MWSKNSKHPSLAEEYFKANEITSQKKNILLVQITSNVMQRANTCAVFKLLHTSVILHQKNSRPVSRPSSHSKQLHRICTYFCDTSRLCKIPKPTTTCLQCILYALLLYQQHILSLHFVCLHHTNVAVYCISSWHHPHLCVLLDQYVSLGHLLHNGYNLYQKTVNISARCNITFLISDTIHCLPFHPMFCKHGCHNYIRLLTVALLYINL